MSNKPNTKVLNFQPKDQPQIEQPAPVSIDLAREPGHFCPHCFGYAFTDVYGYKTLSRLITTSGKEEVVKILLAVQCVECGWAGQAGELQVMRPSEAVEARNKLIENQQNTVEENAG